MSLDEVGSMSELQGKTYAKSLAKGLLAGMIGGLVATAAKSFAEKIYPPRTHGAPEPPAVLAEKIAGRPLSDGEMTAAEEAIHWGFGAVAGAAYGALVEYYPLAKTKDGAGFGMALNSLTHGTALPAMGLSAEAEDQTAREKTSEMATHLVFGLVTERVRRFVRGMLD
jgi:putative membrane protein